MREIGRIERGGKGVLCEKETIDDDVIIGKHFAKTPKIRFFLFFFRLSLTHFSLLSSLKEIHHKVAASDVPMASPPAPSRVMPPPSVRFLHHPVLEDYIPSTADDEKEQIHWIEKDLRNSLSAFALDDPRVKGIDLVSEVVTFSKRSAMTLRGHEIPILEDYTRHQKYGQKESPFCDGYLDLQKGPSVSKKGVSYFLLLFSLLFSKQCVALL